MVTNQVRLPENVHTMHTHLQHFLELSREAFTSVRQTSQGFAAVTVEDIFNMSPQSNYKTCYDKILASVAFYDSNAIS